MSHLFLINKMHRVKMNLEKANDDLEYLKNDSIDTSNEN